MNLEPDYDEFSSYQNQLACANVHGLEYEFQCDYVRNTTECMEHMQYINYIELLYCNLKPHTKAQQYSSVLLFALICIVMFSFLSITADKFFCPTLEVISKVLGMSEHLAGVTLLAFGNGSPDLFTVFANANEKSLTLYATLLGSGLYIAAFIGGMIGALGSFRVDGANFMRDCLFLLFGTIYMDFLVRDDVMDVYESFSLIIIYMLYLFTILMDQYLLRREVKDLEQRAHSDEVTDAIFNRYSMLQKEAFIDIKNEKPRKSAVYMADEANNPNSELIPQLLDSLSPCTKAEWLEASGLRKFIIILKSPVEVILSILLPVVDYEEDLHGWSKLLNCFQIVFLPFITQWQIMGFSWIIIFATLGATVPLSVLCFLRSRTDEAPHYHAIFTLLTAYGAMSVMFAAASEVVEILFVVGLIMDCSISFLQCTLLAYGNGLGDLIADTTLALHGYHKMAFAATVGGPFFNVMLSIGLVMILKNFSPEADVLNVMPVGPLGENCFIFFVIFLFATVLWSVTTDFHMRRTIGIFNMVMYLLFFLYVFLGELEIVQTYADTTQYGA